MREARTGKRVLKDSKEERRGPRRNKPLTCPARTFGVEATDGNGDGFTGLQKV